MEDDLGLVSRFGKWLDTRFPAKIRTEEVIAAMTAWSKVSETIASFESRLVLIEERLHRIEVGLPDTLAEVNKLKTDMTTVKAWAQLKQKQASNMPDLTGAKPWAR